MKPGCDEAYAGEKDCGKLELRMSKIGGLIVHSEYKHRKSVFHNSGERLGLNLPAH